MPKKRTKQVDKFAPYSSDLIASQFWLHKSLEQMNRREWEAICDGCAKCCLHKFIEDDSEEEDFTPTDQMADHEELLFTNIVCRLLDQKKCACTEYEKRSELVPDCVTLTKQNLQNIFYMPTSCSYRRLHEGRGLAQWHPLLNGGKKALMHSRGVSVRKKVVSEEQMDIHDYGDYIVTWPLEDID